MDSDDETTATDAGESARFEPGIGGPGSEVREVGDDLVGIEAVTYDTETGSYRVRYDRVVDPPSLVVVTVLAAIADRDPVDVTPLHGAVDVDALDALFELASTDGDAPTVSFPIDGTTVTVSGTHVEVRPDSGTVSPGDW